MLVVSARLLALSRAISSPMLISVSEPRNLSSSILASSSAIGCSNSRKFRSMAAPCYRSVARFASRGPEPRAALREQLAQHATMAVPAVLAVAADRKVGVMRERRQRVEQVDRRGLAHLGTETAGESRPPARIVAIDAAHQRQAWRQFRQPDVVVIAPGEFALRHAARRATHCAEACALATHAGAAESHDCETHWALNFRLRRWAPRCRSRAARRNTRARGRARRGPRGGPSARAPAARTIARRATA